MIHQSGPWALTVAACYCLLLAGWWCQQHIVSIAFLTLFIKKITSNTRKIVEWSDQMRASLGLAL